MPRRLLIAVLASLALLLAACGDDGGSSDSDTAAEAGDQADGSSSDGGDGGGDPTPDDVSAFFSGDCRDAVAAFQSALASVGGAFTPGDEAGPEQTAELLDEIAAEAPGEVADDFAVLAEAYAEFAQALTDAGVDFNDPSTFQDPDALAALSSVGEAFDDAEVTQAAENIEAWFDANCTAE